MTDSELTAYCVKCKAVRPIANPEAVYMANGRPATRGVCATCNTGLYKIGATAAHAGVPKPEVTPAAPRAPRQATPEPADDAPPVERPSAPLTQPTEAYCVKCKTRRVMQDGRAVFMANGSPASEGRCPECGTRLFKLGASLDHAALPKPAPDPQRAQAAQVRRAASAKASTTGSTAARKPSAPASGKSAGKVAAPPAGKTARVSPTSRPSSRGAGKLVIVESPAKARTVGRFLGRGYDVRASVGHVRDLLRSKLSVDIERDFTPTYRVPNEKRSLIKELKEAAAHASEVFLATDPDREGEAIAWHLLEAAEIAPERAQRVVFHEITQRAVNEAFAHARDVDMRLVNAQQARRILDRLVGYQVSPLLWSRVRSRLSAGRVQSVALRLIVEREREILAFVPVEYWSVDAELSQQQVRGETPRPSFLARLVRIRGEEANLKDRAGTQAIVDDLERAAYVVSGVKRGERRRRPGPPFTTSTLQQDASQRLGMTAQRTMRVAQELYEGIDIGEGGSVGLITYMRTDSVNVAQEAQVEARALIAERFGPEFVPPEPNVYRARAKNAQEAHEAIRPTSSRRLPEAVRARLNRDQNRLYELIWQRFIASQMAAAVYDTVTVEVEAGAPGATARPYLLRATGSIIKFAGFLVVYSGPAAGSASTNGNAAGAESLAVERDGGSSSSARTDVDSDDPGSAGGSRSQPIPANIYVSEALDLLRLLPEQHFTQPPPRYTEATLVKALEENGIGRPSTYAAIISTILDRGYTERVERKLVPTELGFTVNDLLVRHFDPIFNVGFTAGMEEHLDDIATGEEQLVPVLRDFYDFFAPQLRDAEAQMEKVHVEPEKTGEVCPECGSDLVIKLGRFGKFVACSNYPTCRYTKPLVLRIGVACPKDAGEIVERRTKRGRIFFGCVNYPACDYTSWKRPLPQPCPRCGGLMVVAGRDQAECTVCGERTRGGEREGPAQAEAGRKPAGATPVPASVSSGADGEAAHTAGIGRAASKGRRTPKG